MNIGRLSLCAVVGLLALSACTPNDTKVKTVKERIDGGEIVEFTEPGSKLASCKTSPDWTDIRMQNTERERVVIGKQQSFVGPGNRACYRIGSKVMLDARKPEAGQVTIRSIGLGRLDKIRADDLKGRFWASKEEFNSYLAGVKTRLGGNEQGYVYIIHFAYVAASAVDEKAIKDKETGPDFKETVADGETVDRCTAEWKDFTIAPDYLQPIQTGALKSYFKLGKRNCLKQGLEAEVKEMFNGPIVAKVRITKVRRFKVVFLDEKYFTLNGFDWETLKKFIIDSNAARPEDYITVMDFEFIPPSPAPLVQNCSDLNLTHPMVTNSVILSSETAGCMQPGNLVRVNAFDAQGAATGRLMRVIGRTAAPVAPNIEITFEEVTP